MKTGVPSSPLLHGVSADEIAGLLRGQHARPHGILGPHAMRLNGEKGIVVRAFHPDARAAQCIVDSVAHDMERLHDAGVFATFIAGQESNLSYRLRFAFPNQGVWETDDPYRFPSTVGETDLHLFGEGTHRRLWESLGAHVRCMDGVEGVSFAVWAPNACRVSVVGDFCQWDGRRFPMRQLGQSGVFEIFLPGVSRGALYKYEILTREGDIRLKTDPFAFSMEAPPATASRVVQSTYQWGDRRWMETRAKRNPATEPMAVYEVHLGSWARVPEEGHRILGYREVAPRLVDHVKRFGFTHIQLLPVAEHPFSGSWGYQVSGYYAPTSRHGSPDDFRYFVDVCHQNGIGVILDWVPAHFPRDDFALRRFDGTCLYEHDDPQRGEHPDWGTLIFNYGRNEVCNFLMANALYWLGEFHVDGLRVDAVASMLYLDYSRKEGQWTPNRHGGRENLEAIEFLKATNAAVREEHPGCFTVAEESTAWPGVTRSVESGGLGFGFKWNMGWMHDTLSYFSKDPIHRKYHQDTLTFAMLYEYSEQFIMPLSHDEVVHGKRSLLEKIPGDEWQKFATLRLMLLYQYTRPGKKLLFMGTEIAPPTEWNHETSLDWHLSDDPWRKGLLAFLEELGALYHASPALWREDHGPSGFAWIDCSDRENSVLAYWRRAGGDHRIVVLNLTPVPRHGYRVGVPFPGQYVVRLSSDEQRFGGSEVVMPKSVETVPQAWHGQPQSVELTLPPLGGMVLEPQLVARQR